MSFPQTVVAYFAVVFVGVMVHVADRLMQKSPAISPTPPDMGNHKVETRLHKFFDNPLVQGVGVLLALALAFSGKLSLVATRVCIILAILVGIWGFWSHIHSKSKAVILSILYFASLLALERFLRQPSVLPVAQNPPSSSRDPKPSSPAPTTPQTSNTIAPPIAKSPTPIDCSGAKGRSPLTIVGNNANLENVTTLSVCNGPKIVGDGLKAKNVKSWTTENRAITEKHCEIGNLEDCSTKQLLEGSELLISKIDRVRTVCADHISDLQAQEDSDKNDTSLSPVARAKQQQSRQFSANSFRDMAASDYVSKYRQDAKAYREALLKESSEPGIRDDSLLHYYDYPTDEHALQTIEDDLRRIGESIKE